MEFGSWLEQQLEARQWSQGDLARAAKQQGYKLASSQLSFAINGLRSPSPETCIAIAEGLKIPREDVFRARGWLLEKPTENPQAQLSKDVFEAAVKLEHLPLQARQIALRITHATADAFREENN